VGEAIENGIRLFALLGYNRGLVCRKRRRQVANLPYIQA
jgi:hypothetical protein